MWWIIGWVACAPIGYLELKRDFDTYGWTRSTRRAAIAAALIGGPIIAAFGLAFHVAAAVNRISDGDKPAKW